MGPESALLAEALGVLLELVTFGELEGEVDSSGEPAVGVAVGLPAAEGEVLEVALEGEALGVPDGAEVAEVPEAVEDAVADATGDREGAGSAIGSDFPHPHQGNETMRQPPSPLPFAWATEGIPTAPTTTTAAAAQAVFLRFVVWRCLGIRGLIQWFGIQRFGIR